MYLKYNINLKALYILFLDINYYICGVEIKSLIEGTYKVPSFYSKNV